MLKLNDAIARCPIIPVVTLHHAEDAVPLARALMTGGITTIEITLRTDAGLAAMKAVAQSGLEICVGAGTIFTVQQFRQVVDAGVQFAISPACLPELLAEAARHDVTYLPGVITPSEVAQAEHAGCHLQKFFPAEAFGGVSTLKQYASVFPNVKFCPTGGITPDNAAHYLTLPNVSCAGGTWLAPAEAIAAKDWKRIETLAKTAAALARA